MKKILILGLFLITASVIFFFRPFVQTEFLKIENTLPKMARLAEREIFTPLPLRIENETKYLETVLSQEEIIKQTNIQREKYGLPGLKENLKLRAMAQAKIEDMFEEQYFAHRSPLGQEAGDLAGDFAYEFLAIGENLAMGYFESDEKLVEAWLASPGHRENILSPKYQEIGVAVKKSAFEGESVWLAVQHFGLALTACPEPSKTLKSQVEQKEQELKRTEELLLELRVELQKIRPKWGSYYQEKAEEYNDLVQEYNNILRENQILINQYNGQVQEFNQCLGRLKT